MISSSYLMLIVATLVIGMGAQWYVNHKLKTYSHVANSTGLTGAEAARQMLSYYGILECGRSSAAVRARTTSTRAATR